MDASDEESDTSAFKVASQVLIGLTVTIENLVLIAVIGLTPKLHTTKYVFTASLALTDTIIGVLVVLAVPLNLSFVFTPEGNASVVTTLFIMVSTGMVMLSIAQMAIMAMERYIYIGHPFFYQRHLTPRAIRWMMVLFWALGLISLALPFIAQAFLVREYVSEVGTVNVYIRKGYILSGYVVMTVLTCVCYLLILCLARKHRRAVRAWETAKNVPSWREHAKGLKFFLLVFGFYLVMTSPGFIEECLPEVFNVSDGLKTVFLLAISFNSGINFLILNVVDRSFRQIMKERLFGPIKILSQYLCPSKIGNRSLDVID